MLALTSNVDVVHSFKCLIWSLLTLWCCMSRSNENQLHSYSSVHLMIKFWCISSDIYFKSHHNVYIQANIPNISQMECRNLMSHDENEYKIVLMRINFYSLFWYCGIGYFWNAMELFWSAGQIVLKWRSNITIIDIFCFKPITFMQNWSNSDDWTMTRGYIWIHFNNFDNNVNKFMENHNK